MSSRSLPPLHLIATEEGRLRVDPADVDAATADIFFTTGDKAYRGQRRSRGLADLVICVLVLKDGFTTVGAARPGQHGDRADACGETLALQRARNKAERRLRWTHNRAQRSQASADSPQHFSKDSR